MATPTKPISWSELKTFQRCPKQHEYKYIQRLVPKAKSRPLYLGSWGHSALEAHYKLGNWRRGHDPFVKEWNSLFQEEREHLMKRGRGKSPPLPEIIERIMRSYEWYYRHDEFRIVAVEQEFEVDTPLILKGEVQRLQGIIDLILEDTDGLWWIWDHKFVGNIPDPTAFHAMDPQLMLYPWAAKEMWGWNIAGIVYNYVKSKPPTIPKLTAKTGQISRRKVNTDYPTLFRFLRENGYDPHDYRDILLPLKKKSPFLRRYKMPRERQVTKEILLDSLSTARRIRSDKRRYRVITRDCQRGCAYHDICRAELNGLDTTLMRKQMFTLKEKDSGRRSKISLFEDEDDSEEEE